MKPFVNQIKYIELLRLYLEYFKSFTDDDCINSGFFKLI